MRSFRTGVALLSVAGLAVISCPGGAHAANAAVDPGTAGGGEVSIPVAPSPLFAVDRNRASIVDGIVANWKASLEAAYAEATPEKEAALRAALSSLRADRLLSASLAGTLEGLGRALSEPEAAVALAATPGGTLLKALGDSGRDLVYTPVNPCRIVDTRTGSGGFVAPNSRRDWNVSRPGGTFTDQGGEATDCSIPAGPAAVLVNVAVTGSPAAGVLYAWAFGQPAPLASTLNWASGQTIVNGVIVPVASGLAKDLSVVTSAATQVIIDVLGYMSAPTTPVVQSLTAGDGISVTGTTVPTVAVKSGYRLPQGCSLGQVAKLDATGNWACGTDDTTGGGTNGGTVTSITAGPGLVGGLITTTGTIAADTAYLQRRVSAACAAGSTIRSIAADGTVACETGYVQGGNSFGALPGNTALLGTTDANALEVQVAGARVVRYAPNATSANVIAGHPANSVGASVYGATVAGGGKAGGDCFDSATGTSTRACANIAGGLFATVGGGESNAANGQHASVGGGNGNGANADSATVGGGAYNVATGTFSTVAGGAGNAAYGDFSFSAGASNRAGGRGSVVLGQWGESTQNGCFVFGDDSTVNKVSCSSAPNAFVARALGGFYLYTAGNSAQNYTGAYLASGSSAWTAWSDRNGKENVAPVDPETILEKIAAMPISTWNWKSQSPGIRHIGPMAQDFYAAFGLGETERGISTIDAQGVALAAIQGLHRVVQEKDRRLERQDDAIAQLRAKAERVEALEREVQALKSAVQGLGRPEAHAR